MFYANSAVQMLWMLLTTSLPMTGVGPKADAPTSRVRVGYQESFCRANLLSARQLLTLAV
jgi:hypothetical protein